MARALVSCARLVHRIPHSTFVTTRNAPPDERGTAVALLPFLANEKAKYFFAGDWTSVQISGSQGKAFLLPLRETRDRKKAVGSRRVRPARGQCRTHRRAAGNAPAGRARRRLEPRIRTGRADTGNGGVWVKRRVLLMKLDRRIDFLPRSTS